MATTTSQSRRLCGALRCVRIAMLIVTIHVWSAETTQGQDEGAKRFLRWAHQDAFSLMRDVSMNAAFITSATTVVLLPSSRLDDSVLREVQAGYDGALGSYLRATNKMGGPTVLPATVGIFGATLVVGDKRLQDAAFTSMQSVMFAGAITSMLKFTFGRYRPNADDGPYRFDSFSRHSSFPSGHATLAFAVVTPWVLYYPNVATYTLFALSTGTAVARIALDKHWPTDVLAGAAIGFLTARYLTNRHLRDARLRPKVGVSPAISDAGTGVQLTLRLN